MLSPRCPEDREQEAVGVQGQPMGDVRKWTLGMVGDIPHRLLSFVFRARFRR